MLLSHSGIRPNSLVQNGSRTRRKVSHPCVTQTHDTESTMRASELSSSSHSKARADSGGD